MLLANVNINYMYINQFNARFVKLVRKIKKDEEKSLSFYLNLQQENKDRIENKSITL